MSTIHNFNENGFNKVKIVETGFGVSVMNDNKRRITEFDNLMIVLA